VSAILCIILSGIGLVVLSAIGGCALAFIAIALRIRKDKDTIETPEAT
jgi:hypothetical protein